MAARNGAAARIPRNGKSPNAKPSRCASCARRACAHRGDAEGGDEDDTARHERSLAVTHQGRYTKGRRDVSRRTDNVRARALSGARGLRTGVADHTTIANEIEGVDDRLDGERPFLEAPVADGRRDAALDLSAPRTGQ